MLANGGNRNNQNDDRKIIVRQLDFQTGQDSVHEYFSQFGELDEVLMKFNEQGKSKGFCFVIFSNISTLNNVLQNGPHRIDNKEVNVQKAIPRNEQNKTKKLFCGGLPHGLTEDMLQAYFCQYGEIANFEFIFDNQTGTRKHFCFVVFQDAESVEKITEGKLPPQSVLHYIEKFRVECKKKFEDNHPLQKKVKDGKGGERTSNSGGYGGGGGRGGGGRGRGGGGRGGGGRGGGGRGGGGYGGGGGGGGYGGGGQDWNQSSNQGWGDQSSYGQQQDNGYSGGYGGDAGYGGNYGGGYDSSSGYTDTAAVGYPAPSTTYPTAYPSAPAPSDVGADQGYSGTNQQNFTQGGRGGRGGYNGNQKAGGPMKQRGGGRGGYRPY